MGERVLTRVAGVGLSLAMLGALAGSIAWFLTSLFLPGRRTLPTPVLVACTAPWGVALAGLAVAALAGGGVALARRSARRDRAGRA